MTDFERDWIVDYRDWGLSCRSISAHIGRNPIFIYRIWNQWIQEGFTECCDGSQQLAITNSQEDRHLTRMALMDYTVTLRTLNQKMGSFAMQQVSAEIVRRCLQQHGLSPWIHLPLMLHHSKSDFNSVFNNKYWTQKWHEVVFSEES